MKRFALTLLLALLLLTVCTACLVSCQESEAAPPREEPSPSSEAAAPPSKPESKPAPEPTTAPTTAPEPPAPPEEVVGELLQSVKEWDTASINEHLPAGSSLESQIPPGFDGAVSSLLARMEYKVGQATVTGDTAAVAVELTAADAEKAVGDAVAGILAKAAFAKLTGQEIKDYTPLVEEAVRAIDVDALPTVTKSATAYMLRDGDGEWKLDAENGQNLPLLNAATGGAVDAAKKLADLADNFR